MKTGLYFLIEKVTDLFLYPVIKKFWEGSAEGIGKAAGATIERKLVARDRHDFLGFIRLTLWAKDAQAAENILKHQRDRQGAPENGKPYKPGDENTMMNLLADFWRHSVKKWKKANTIQLFQWIGHLSDKDFDAFIEALNDDGFEQFVRRAIVACERGGKNADAAVAAQLRQFNDWLEDNSETVPYTGTRTIAGSITAIILIVVIVGFFAVQAAKLL